MGGYEIIIYEGERKRERERVREKERRERERSMHPGLKSVLNAIILF